LIDIDPEFLENFPGFYTGLGQMPAAALMTRLARRLPKVTCTAA
jgi:hypothetical protein